MKRLLLSLLALSLFCHVNTAKAQYSLEGKCFQQQQNQAKSIMFAFSDSEVSILMGDLRTGQTEKCIGKYSFSNGFLKFYFGNDVIIYSFRWRSPNSFCVTDDENYTYIFAVAGSSEDTFMRDYLQSMNNSTYRSYPNSNSNNQDKCSDCHGSGRCSLCNGSGSNPAPNYSGSSNYDSRCPRCYGSGSCQGCHGSGRR